MNWRDRLRAERREAILEAAAEVFAQKGYQRATMRDIARRVGIAPGTIYLYFRNKRHLLLAIADRLIAQRVGQVLAQASDLEPREYVAAVLHERLEFFERNQPFLQALVSEIWTDPSLRRQFFAHVLAPIFTGGARYLEKKVAEGRVRPCRVDVVIPAVAGSIILLSLVRVFVPEHPLAQMSEEDLVDELTRLYLFGLAAGEQAP